MADATPQPDLKEASKNKVMLPNAGHAVVGTSLIVLLVELGRSGALAQYHDFLAPLLSWGPGLLIVAGQIWIVAKFLPPFIESQNKVASGMAGLAGAVQTSAAAVQASRDEQRDTIFNLQLLAKKIEELAGDIAELEPLAKKIEGLQVNIAELSNLRNKGTAQ